MKLKKIMATISLGVGLITMGACGNAGKQEDKLMDEKLDQTFHNLSEEDVVSEKEESINGEKMVTKKFKDGTEITMPKGMSLDDIKTASSDGELIKGAEEKVSEKEK